MSMPKDDGGSSLPSAPEGYDQDTDNKNDADGEDIDDLFSDTSDVQKGNSRNRASVSRVLTDESESAAHYSDYDSPDKPMEVEEEQQYLYMDVDLCRQRGPLPSDGEFYLMKVPPFLVVDPKPFDPATFQVSKGHKDGQSNTEFSAYTTAMSTIRWRFSPSNSTELQSNARILRWSNGSLTMQFASDPTTQFAIAVNPLAPVQKSSQVITPALGSQKGMGSQSTQDTYTYLCAPYPESGIIQVVQKVTASLTVIPPKGTTDLALEHLQSQFKAASNSINSTDDGGVTMVEVAEDPELAQRKAEAAEKEKIKLQRKLENQMNKERDRVSRVFGRSGSRLSGFSTGAWDENEREGARRARTKPRKTNREAYNSEDEYADLRKGSKENEYDEDDEFIAKSDEDLKTYEDDEGDYGKDSEDGNEVGDENEVGKSSDEEGNGFTNARHSQFKPRVAVGGVGRMKRMSNDGIVEGRDRVSGGESQGYGDNARVPANARKKRRVIDDEDDD